MPKDGSVEKPSPEVVKEIFTKLENTDIPFSKTLKGILGGIEGGLYIPDNIWESVVEEYQSVLHHLLDEKQRLLETYRSYDYFVSFVKQTMQQDPENVCFEFYSDNRLYQASDYFTFGSPEDDYPLVFSTRESLVCWLTELFGGPLPEYFAEQLASLPTDAYHILLAIDYMIIPEDEDSFGMECNVEIAYKLPYEEDKSCSPEANGLIDMTYTFGNMHEGYTFLMSNRKDDSTIDQMIIYEEDEFFDRELDLALEDTDIFRKLKEYDKELFYVIDTYCKEKNPECHEDILEKINKQREWKDTLRRWSQEWTIGRLRYILQNRSHDYFDLRFVDNLKGEYEPTPMLIYPADTHHAQKMIQGIERIFETSLPKHLAERETIAFSALGVVHDNETIIVTIVFTHIPSITTHIPSLEVQQPQYTHKDFITVEQLFDLMQLFTDEKVYISGAFKWGNERDEYEDDEHDDEFDDEYDDEFDDDEDEEDVY